jgi:hypothetical protein
MLTASASVILREVSRVSDLSVKKRACRKASSMIGNASSMFFVSRLIPLMTRIDQNNALVKVKVYVHPLNYSVNLMSPPGPFTLLAIVHYTMFDLRKQRLAQFPSLTKLRHNLADDPKTYFVIQTTSFRIRQHNDNIWVQRFDKLPYSCNCAAGT